MDPIDSSRREAPRLEVRGASPSLRHAFGLLALLASVVFVGGLASSAEPSFGLALSMALPIVFAGLGLGVASKGRAGPYVVRFFEDVLEVESGGVVRRTEWEDIHEATETVESVVVALPAGGHVALPRAGLPDDGRALIDALPAHVRLTVAPTAVPGGRASPAVVTLAVVGFVALICTALWQLVT